MSQITCPYRTTSENAEAQKKYNHFHKNVRQNIRRDKRSQVEKLAKEAELAESQRNMKELYNMERKEKRKKMSDTSTK